MVLNADTVVTEGWLDRLVDAAARRRRRHRDPAHQLRVDLHAAHVDHRCLRPRRRSTPHRRVRRASWPASASGCGPDVITGVGFCMYVTRAALDLCGALRRGGLRPRLRRGGRLLPAGHPARAPPRRRGLDLRVPPRRRVLRRRARRAHARRVPAAAQALPFFREANRREQADDPLDRLVRRARARPGRARPRSTARAAAPARTAGRHRRHREAPPGAARRARRRATTSRSCTRSRPASSCPPAGTAGGLEPTVVDFLLPGTVRNVTALHDAGAAEALAMALDLFDVDAVHIHNIKGHSLAPLQVLRRLRRPGRLLGARPLPGLPALLAALPRRRAVRHPRRPHGLRPVPARDRGTLARSARGVPADRVAAGVARIDHWVLPSRSAADYLLRAYDVDPDRLEIIEHGSTIDPGRGRWLDEGLVLDEPLRLAFVGRGWAKKGLGAVNHLAEALADTDIEVHHFGPMTDAAVAAPAHARRLRQPGARRAAAPDRHPDRRAARAPTPRRSGW